jgi:hypothetical protein
VQAYDFDIEYVKGKNNVVVDALSRRLELCSLSKISADWKSELLMDYSKSKFACEVMDNSVQDDRYKVVDDIIYYKDHIYLVLKSKLKEKIMKAMHDTPINGNPGYFKTYRKIRERFSWKGLKYDVLRNVRECVTCQQNKVEQTHLARLLHPLPIPEKKWENISMEFITGLPKTRGRDCIYVVVDRLTNFTHFFSISSKYKATKVADLLFKEVFKLHGLSKNIVSDRNSQFMSAFWQELFRLTSTELTASTSYHP